MKQFTPEKITDYRWLNLFRCRFENKGNDGEWMFVSRKNDPHGKDSTSADAVTICAVWHGPNGEKKVVINKEYRIPINGEEYAFPAGLLNKGEEPAETAARELKEETGLTLTKVRLVSPRLFTSAGLTDESGHIVFCDCEGELSHAGHESSESITTMLLSNDELDALLQLSDVKFSAKAWLCLVFMWWLKVGSKEEFDGYPG